MLHTNIPSLLTELLEMKNKQDLPILSKDHYMYFMYLYVDHKYMYFMYLYVDHKYMDVYV